MRRSGRYVVAVLSLAYLLAMIDRMMLSLLIEPIKADFHLTDTEMGLLAGLAFGVFYTLLGVPLGRLADRMHRPALITSGLLLWSLATMSCGLTGSFTQLFLARICVGVGEASISPASYSLIADYVPRPRLGRALSVYMLGTVGGLGIAWIVGGQLVRWLAGFGPLGIPIIGHLPPWKLVFLAAGLPGLLVAPFTLMISDRRHAAPVGHPRARPPAAVRLGAVWQQLRAGKRVYLAHFLGIATVNTYASALVTWAPAMFHRSFAWSIELTGMTLGSGLLLVGVGGMLFSGHIVDYLTERGYDDAPFRVLFLGTLMMVPIGILGPLTDIAWLRAALFVVPVMGLFFAVVACAPTALQLATPPAMRGSVSAIYLFIVNIVAFAVGPLAVGLVSDRLFSPDRALAYALMIMAVLCLPVGALAFRSGLAPFRRMVHTLYCESGGPASRDRSPVRQRTTQWKQS